MVRAAQGGDSAPRYCTDCENIFRQESYFAYLFGALEPGLSGAVDLRTGLAYLFVPRQDEAYAPWVGAQKSRAHYKQRFGVAEVHYTDEMVRVLGEDLQAATLHVLRGVNSDSGLPARSASFEGMSNFVVDETLLFDALAECRVVKSEAEIEVLAYVNRICSAAHVAVMQECAPGMMEYEAEARFLFECYKRGGMRLPAYTPIVASGRRAAQLHYGHAGAPNAGAMRDGELVLMDLGCEYCAYGADITSTIPVSGRFTPDQRAIYDAVLNAQLALIAAVKPGVSMKDLHHLGERHVLSGLKKAGLLVGKLDEMLRASMGAVFMPHGLGHFVGLDTHDVGGYGRGCPPRPKTPGACYLRTARTLKAGMVLTVEPAVYFIPELLSKALRKPATARFFDTQVLSRLLVIGGVRLEDDVVVTRTGCVNLTNLPRSCDDVEAVMAGAKWPREVIKANAYQASGGTLPHEPSLGESVEGIRRVRSLTDIVIEEETSQQLLAVVSPPLSFRESAVDAPPEAEPREVELRADGAVSALSADAARSVSLEETESGVA